MKCRPKTCIGTVTASLNSLVEGRCMGKPVRKRRQSGGGEAREMTQPEEEFKLIFKFKDKDGKALNPLKLSAELKDKIGVVLNTNVLVNGNILVFCKTEAQRAKGLKVKQLLNFSVECFIPNKGGQAKGVIYVSQEISDSDIAQNINGAEVESARFKATGTAVLLTFRQEALPERVTLGYMSYPVRQYNHLPLRCYKCQLFGHVAAACRGTTRCGKCGENHSFRECTAELVKCCNCGGDHMPSSKVCKYHQKAVEVEKVIRN